ncbi:MAG: tRNA pseudouridine(55) synthase TruB [Prevotellaceae bacterium]|nr:tRNA pseudouridine(55) synthase TruB [Prevotellaceae bacterium]
MEFQEGKILYFNKPLNWTSFDLVNRVRNIISKHTGQKIKVGHAGTLDPLASGVMILCTGKATKKIEDMQYLTKEYVATLKLGETTPSFDLEHPVDFVYPTEHINRELIDSIIPQFIGEIWQRPPVYSAVKIDGKRAYSYARQGKEVDIQPKLLVIDQIEVLNFEKPFLTLKTVCSKGTYIRALARDIGIALGSGAHLTALQRTRTGNIKLDDCITIEEFIKILNNRIIE